MYKITIFIMLLLSLVISPFGKMVAYGSHESDMSSMTQGSSMHHQMNFNSMGKPTEMNSEHMECCEVECVCPINACHAFTYLPQSTHSLDIVSGFEKFQATQIAPRIPTISNLFRPPILPSLG